MSNIAVLETILKLIDGQEHDRAAGMWASIRSQTGNCQPCFNSPLPQEIRCAACLEKRLDLELGKHGNPGAFMDQLASARQSLGAWIEAQHS